MMRKLLILGLMSLIIGLAFATTLAHEGEADDHAHLRIAHLSPDAPNIDVFVDGSAALTDVPYLAVSAPIIVEPGVHTLIVTQTRAGIDAPLFTVEMTAEAGHWYTAAAIGLVSDASVAPLLIDETAQVEAAGLTESPTAVVVVNAVNGIPGYDILFNRESGDEMFMENLAFGEVRAGEFPVDLTPVNVTVSGERTDVLVETQFFGLPNTVTLTILVGTREQYYPIFYPRTSLTSGNWLRAAGEISPYYRFNTLAAGIAAIAEVPEIQALSVEPNSTFFAPVDTAFATLPEGTVEALLADPDTLAQILLTHGVQGPLYGHDIFYGLVAGGGSFSVTSAQGSPLTFTPSENPLLVQINGGPNLVFANIQTADGIINVIDGGVLMPAEE